MTRLPDDPDELRLIDFLVDEFFEDGIVLAGYPEKLPCRCVTVDEKKLCTRRGVIGTLAQDQLDLCSQFREEPNRRRERILAFRQAVGVCRPEIEKIPEGRERLLAWLGCMGRELRARGVEPR